MSHPFSLSKREIPPTMLAPEFFLALTNRFGGTRVARESYHGLPYAHQLDTGAGPL